MALSSRSRMVSRAAMAFSFFPENMSRWAWRRVVLASLRRALASAATDGEAT